MARKDSTIYYPALYRKLEDPLIPSLGARGANQKTLHQADNQPESQPCLPDGGKSAEQRLRGKLGGRPQGGERLSG